MKTDILHRHVLHEAGHSFSYRVDVPFTMPLHRHSDYELIYITQGHGLEFVGEAVRAYRAGELILIGAHVPHLHLCNPVTHPTEPERSLCEIVQFPQRLFPEEMSDIPEYSSVYRLLTRSAQGIKFTSTVLINRTRTLLHRLTTQKGMEHLLTLFQLLAQLGTARNFQLISPIAYPMYPYQPVLPHEPLAKIYDYLHRHFREKITLEALAHQVQTHPSSLCRSFQRATHTSPFEYLTRLRIEHACKLLTYSPLTVSQIAYEVGFNNLAHFNKQFKRLTQQTPTHYRKTILSEIP